MNREQNYLTEYLENVRYYSETSTVSELPHVLKKIYEQVKSQPDIVNESLAQALDLNVRQLLKNTLTEKVAYSELPFFQKALTIAESVLKRAQDQRFSDKYISRWHFANDVIKDRKHELSVNKQSFALRPQVKRLLKLLAAHDRLSRETIEQELSVSKQRATNLIRDIKALSLVDEFVLPDDKRRREYAISDEGKKVCQAIGINGSIDKIPADNTQSTKVRAEVHKAINNEKAEAATQLTPPPDVIEDADDGSPRTSGAGMSNAIEPIKSNAYIVSAAACENN